MDGLKSKVKSALEKYETTFLTLKALKYELPQDRYRKKLISGILTCMKATDTYKENSTRKVTKRDLLTMQITELEELHLSQITAIKEGLQ